MNRHRVARVDQLQPGQRLLVEVDGRSVGLFNVNGSIRAVLNRCPHAKAPVCQGRWSGTTLPSAPGDFRWGRDGEILACPWHGWEFDLLTGAALAAPHRLTLYEVVVDGGDVYVLA